MAQISDYRTKVQSEVDDTSSSASTVIDRSIKATYQEILKRVGRYLVGTTNETATATSGTADYTPTGFMEMIDVQYKPAGQSDYTRLKRISMEDYLANHVNDENNDPHSFVVNGLSVKLVPTPNDAGTIRYEYLDIEGELTGTETSLIPDRYEDAMIMGACYRFFAYDTFFIGHNYTVFLRVPLLILWLIKIFNWYFVPVYRKVFIFFL